MNDLKSVWLVVLLMMAIGTVWGCDDGGTRDGGGDSDSDTDTDADSDSDTDTDSDTDEDGGTEDSGPDSYCVDAEEWGYDCEWPSGAACGMMCCGPCRINTFYNACGGICCGTCNGVCDTMDGDDCLGFCDGICEGSCTTLVDGQCTGECLGECTVD